MDTLTFKYARHFAVVAFFGFPLLAILSPGLVVAAAYVIADASAPMDLRVQTILLIPIGIFFGVVVVTAARTWYSLLSEYSVSQAGIQVTYFSTILFLHWRDLQEARYRKIFGQLELRFRSYPRLVVLTNVDMDWERKTVLAALQLAETAAPIPITRTAF
jgi:hypothetical protein